MPKCSERFFSPENCLFFAFNSFILSYCYTQTVFPQKQLHKIFSVKSKKMIPIFIPSKKQGIMDESGNLFDNLDLLPV